ncbi:MAG: peptide chain release factor N(5)-glutamine methyltransferase [Eubacteriales bacterium]|nr:peptide chain release factor N(5)-glutamine methyltransferase [Eubacteriales bacterium]
MATIEELLLIGKQRLEESGNEYAKYERKVLLEEALGCNYMYMLMNAEETVEVSREQQYLEWIRQRCNHYPLQYILGKAHFMDFTFYVNENVLIPRNDTEILVETANELLDAMQADNTKIRVLDLCCGSGCIGISLKKYHKDIALVLSDYSEKALEVTKKNLELLQVEAETLHGDLFEPFVGKANLIVSNPPYIESEVIGTLMPEVREYEPMMALDGGADGLDFYKRIIDEAPMYLENCGYLVFEIGCNQAKEVMHLMTERGFSNVQVRQDYAGLDRVVFGQI